jgi:hypothetical protein
MRLYKSAQQARNFIPADPRSGLYGRNERPGPVLLRASFHAKGRSAPSRHPLAALVPVALAVLSISLVVPSAASAHFVRPFLRQIAGTPAGGEGAVTPFEGPSDVAVDGTDDLWVADEKVTDATGARERVLDEFGPTGAFMGTLAVPSPKVVSGAFRSESFDIQNFAIATNSPNPLDPFAGDFYVSSDVAGGNTAQVEIFSKAGTLEKSFPLPQPPGGFGNVHERMVALDNSTDPLDPSAGDLYVYGNGGVLTSLTKYNASGEPENWEGFVANGFSGCGCSSSGNEITFTPGDEYGQLTVNQTNGDIWVTTGSDSIFELTPRGEVIREIPSENEAPGLPHSEGHGFVGRGVGRITALAVDSSNEDLLVSLDGHYSSGSTVHTVGAVDEFNAEGAFLGQITEAAGRPLAGAFELAGDSHGHLYVVNRESDYARKFDASGVRAVEEFEAGHFVPTVSPAAASRRTPTSEVLNGTVDPESTLSGGAGLTDCHFEYVSEAGFQANDVDELQSVTLAGASGGTFALSLGGQSLAASGTGGLAGPVQGTGDLIEGSNTLTGVSATSGAFAPGDQISGEGVPKGATILSVHPGIVVLSADATASGAGVALSAVSDEVTALSVAAGTFAAGEEISGAGIPAATTILAVHPGGLTLSADITAPGSAVALTAGLAHDASSAQVQSALEGLSTIGPGNVAVSGGAGGPYTIEFTGAPQGLADTSVAQLGTESSSLTPAGASVTAVITRQGGDGWGTATSAPCEHPDVAEIPMEDAEIPVHAVVSEHLQAGVTYRYRLSATLGGAKGGSALSAPTASTIPAAPQVAATAASEVTSTFATLSAEVDPLGVDTAYQFQYLPEEQLESSGGSWAAAATAPASPAAVGSGGEAGDHSERVLQRVGGLRPGTAYRFRVVASSEAGSSEGEAAKGGGEVAHAFTTQPVVAPVLPDNRAYELMTPPNKEEAEDLFGEQGGGSIDQGASSESGDQFLLNAHDAAFGAFPATGGDAYVFTRHPVAGDPEREEWSYVSLASPAAGVQNLGEFDDGAVAPADLSKVAFVDNVGAPDNGAGAATVTFLGAPGGPYTTIHADQPTKEGDLGGTSTIFPEEKTEVVGASHDLGVVVLKSDNPALAEGGLCEHDVCPGAVIPNLFEWVDGTLSQVDVKSDGAPVSPCGAALGGGATGQSEIEDGAVSADGSKIFFTAPFPTSGTAREAELEGVTGCANRQGANPIEVYMRSGEETTEISAPEKGAPEYPKALHPAVFVRATEDGSRVFFISEGELTANDAGIHDMELYEYETATGELTRISAGDSGEAAGGVVSLREVCHGLGCSPHWDIAASSDGSRVYFVAQGDLAPRNAEGKEPKVGGENMYAYDTQTGRTAFITTFTDGNRQAFATPEVTSEGRFVLFYGEEGLDRYDAETESLVCVTCSASAGPRPQQEVNAVTYGGESFNYGGLRLPDTLLGGQDKEHYLLPPHSISEEGSYVFFQTTVSLVPQDTNGELDVYEWHEGRISLLSSGQDPLPSYFLGASPNGANVFIGTHARLVPADTSGGGNLYDVRICEPEKGNPCIQAAPAQEGLCEGDACSHPPGAPNDATPTSLTFSGAGDLPASTVPTPGKSCPKAKQLSHGSCVKSKRGKAKAKRRNAKAKRGKAKAKGTRSSRVGRAMSKRGAGR